MFVKRITIDQTVGYNILFPNFCWLWRLDVILFPFQVLSTDFGLRVTFDGNNDAQIQISPDWKGVVCGLCGDFNGDPADDLKMADGSQVSIGGRI